MSFRLFIYYCAVCGAWAAVLGWVLSRVVGHFVTNVLLCALLQGLCLGVLVVVGLSVVDALGNLHPVQAPRIAIAAGVGLVGSLAGAALGQLLYNATSLDAVRAAGLVVGWTMTGLLIGASLGVAELVQGITRGAVRKLVNGVLGGTLGGLLGGILYLFFGLVLGWIFGRSSDQLRSSSAVGYVTLGGCIGLFIGLAQVVLKEAWVKVESGFRAGREMILSKPETTLGRAEGSDMGLFQDPLVEKVHARIVHQGGRYLLADAGSASGTWLNDVPVTEPMPLTSGDAIRLGNTVLRFGERRAAAEDGKRSRRRKRKTAG
jgi:hypothetical protein